MKVVVREVGHVPLVFRQRVTFVAAGTGVEQLPAAHGGVIDGVPFAGDEVIEGRIERHLWPLVRGDGTHEVGAVGRWPKTPWKASWYSATVAILATAASMLGCPISIGLMIGS